MLRKIALSQMLVLALALGQCLPVMPVYAQQMDAIGAMSPASQEYQKKIIKEVSSAWAKNIGNHWKFSFYSHIAIKVDPSGNLSGSIAVTSRNLSADRISVDCVKKAKMGPPPAGWNPDQIVYMYLNYKVMNARNIKTPGFPAFEQFREGLVQYNKKENQKALECFAKSTQIDPVFASGYANYGGLLAELGRNNEAIQAFKESLRLDPEDDELRFALAKCCLLVKDDQDAKRVAAEINPVSKYYSRAQDLIAGRGEFATASTSTSQAAVSSNAGDAPTIYNKGVTEQRAGNLLEAVKSYKKVIEIDPNHQFVHSALGSAYISLNQIPEAEAELEKAFAINPNDDDTKYMLGSIYIALNKTPEAIAVLKTIKPGASGYDFAQKQLKALQAESSSTGSTSSPTRTNQTTVESVVTSDGNSVVKDKWALVIGISKFANPQYNLKYAAKDAQDFYNYLVTDGNFKKDHVLLLLNENATRRNIMSAFGDKFLPAVCREGDLVTIYISTHGTPASKDPGQRNFIIAYDTEAEALYETGVDMDELYRRVKEGVKTERALIVMDTCYSGAGVPGARGVDAGANFDAALLAQGSGHLVMTSSSPSERSWESKVTPNGVFTKYLIQNLKLTKGNVKNSFDKLKDDVGWEVQNAFNQQQHPQIGGQWQGKEMILNSLPTSPRQVLNPDLLKLMNLSNTPKTPVKK
jgi:tetratricopeptide (TPR) repeat protein